MFDFVPLVLHIVPVEPVGSTVSLYGALNGTNGVQTEFSDGATAFTNFTWTGNTVSWYSSSGLSASSYQLNNLNSKYIYVAIG